MWKRLTIFIVITFLLMALISSIYAQNQARQVSTTEEHYRMDSYKLKAIHKQGIALNDFGSVIQNEEGELIHWNHPRKYFCDSGYLRYKKDNSKVMTFEGNYVNEADLISIPETHVVKSFINNLLVSKDK
ncbi:hypothetical protein [Natranaerobius trueperi]|uniref:Copper amine oxidase-like N-terminal domain-containing protein n=1 Tax=Natranaerobius trueperi TaxID=759412 RepID=A0A226C198_9FIRM|nr:hypothetical protein [Natranaerobius trueperi]OWZ84792.1 hypothetical protein CDO51_01890 [Natranaerobius trueperi]